MKGLPVQQQPTGSFLGALQHAVDSSSLWLVFALLGGSGASVLALGKLLRSNEKLTARVVVGTVLHSTAWGAAVFMLMVDNTSLGLAFTVGLSVFSGMGVASFIDLVLLLIKQRMGISVTFNPPPKEP